MQNGSNTNKMEQNRALQQPIGTYDKGVGTSGPTACSVGWWLMADAGLF
jgi:hypothetical protein